MQSDEYANEALDELFMRAKAQFGSAVKTCWFYTEDECPGCGSRRIGPLKHQGKDSLSLNAFIYREDGVLIGYMLCGNCAAKILKTSQKKPHAKTSLHAAIEERLIQAYPHYIGRFEA